MNQLTDQQAAAVAADGNVLVMAGAGTGKTSTLVARVAERLTRATDPVRADRLLMVTFTEAAAAEMRSRLRERLERLAANASGGLVEQVARLELAVIGTLHSFCLQLLREHGTQLGLEPQVAVLDAVEAGRLASQVWGRRLESWLGAGGPAGDSFRAMAEGWFDGDLNALWETVRGVHGYLRTLADPEGWLRAQEEMWNSPTPEAWRGWLEEFLPLWRQGWVDRFAGTAAIQPLVGKRRSLLQAGLPGSGARRAWFDCLRENPTEYTKGKKTVEREALIPFFEEVEFLRQLESADPNEDPLSEDWRLCQPWMQTLLAVVRGFGESFQLEKRARGGVDFSDLEQYALDLLVRRPGGVVEWCRERFDLVVVDECQDLNAAQDAILRAVSREGARANRFLVGDVKQSIYRFRLADPRLFQATAEAWSRPGGDGQVIPLTGNFRSAEALLGFVNRVCGRLLRPEVGGVAYGPGAALEFGDPAGRGLLSIAADTAPRVEVHVRVKARNGTDEAGEDSSGAELSTAAAEARLIARRLRELKESGLPVWDRRRGALRPVEWSDMAVLLRAEKGRVGDYALEFRAMGVPLVARQNGFFLVPAVSDLRNLLRILDNPLQDIPLGAVLRSPLVGLWEPDELAAVRLSDRRMERWWTLIQRFHLTGVPEGLPVDPARQAWERIDRFVRRYEAWRRLAIRSGAAAALEAALDDTGYEAWAEQQGDGGETVANVRRFLEMARKFDRGSRGGLYRFLLWLDAEEAADRTEPAVGSQTSAVQLMTVHRSKGLEFPVVAVAGLGNRFQMSDLTSARLVRDEIMGLCPLVVAPDGRRYPSVGLWLAQRRQRRESLGEELRLLYVALTRAADRLLLFGTATSNAVESNWAEVADRLPRPSGPMAVEDVEGASSPLGWLGPVLVRDSGPEWGHADAGRGEGFDWTLRRDLPAAEEKSPAESVAPVVDEGEGGEVPGYPHRGATLEPAKVTATGLRRRMAEDLEGLDVGRRAFGMKHGVSDPRDGTAVDRGLAHHRFMELVDPDRTGDDAAVRGEVARILATGGMKEEEAALLDVPAIVRFWNSDLGGTIRQRSAELHREIPFTVRLTAADLRALGFTVAQDLAPDEFVVGQGVVDLALVGPKGIVILDFKTDRVEPGRIPHEKAAQYRPQLAVYALALARIHGRPVTGRWLHFLATGESVEV